MGEYKVNFRTYSKNWSWSKEASFSFPFFSLFIFVITQKIIIFLLTKFFTFFNCFIYMSTCLFNIYLCVCVCVCLEAHNIMYLRNHILFYPFKYRSFL